MTDHYKKPMLKDVIDNYNFGGQILSFVMKNSVYFLLGNQNLF